MSDFQARDDNESISILVPCAPLVQDGRYRHSKAEVL